MTTLTSRSNPKIKQIRLLLQQRKARTATGLFVAEGIRHVGEAVQSGAALEYICYAPELLTSPFATLLIQEQAAQGVPCLAVAAEIFADLAEKDNPPGLLAVVRQRRLNLDQLDPATHPWLVGLIAPQDPGNIGAILRTIDAVGASGLLLLDASADPYNPSAVRASMGAIFWQPLVMASFVEAASWARQYRYTIYGTSAHANRDYLQAAMCDEMLSLPMRGHATSLNLAVATGIMCYAILSRSA
jgi:TrmH family RNA methyltransferase